MSRTYRKHAHRGKEASRTSPDGVRQRPLKSTKQKRPAKRQALRKEYL